MSHGNGTSNDSERMGSPRAGASFTSTSSPQGPLRPHAGESFAEYTYPRADHQPRTEHAARSEAAYRDWAAIPPSHRPLAVAQIAASKVLDEVLHERWLSGDEAYSNVAIGRACGVDEKHVRQWRSGEKRIPMGALLVLPATVVSEIFARISERRGLGRQRNIAVLDQVLERLERTVEPTDRGDLIRALGDAQRRIADLIARLAQGTP